MKPDKKLLKPLNTPPKTSSFWKEYIFEWIVDIVIAVIIVYIITTFAYQNMYVVGSSMHPTLQNSEVVLVSKITYLIKEPERYDIVAFRYKDSENKETNFVKRIIGVPGDKIETNNNTLYVNGQQTQDEIDDYSKEDIARIGNMEYPITVPKGFYFVLGDNKVNSLDSRYQEIGMIPAKELIGKITMRMWPVWKAEIF